MSIDDIRFWVDAAKGFFHNICITGGEALLFPELVQEALNYIHICGFSSSLVSNCSWVHNTNSYEFIVGMLNKCNLSRLAVSYDRFHDQKMFNIYDLERLLSDKNRHFSVVVQPCYLCQDELADIRADLEILCKQYHCDYEPAEVVPFGRARKIVPCSSIVHGTSMPCDVVTMPMIRYDRTYFSCCGPAIGSPGYSPLVHYHADSSVFNIGTSDLIINALFLYGPRYLYDLLPGNLKQIVASGIFIGNVCGLCRTMLDCREIVDFLYAELGKRKWIILCSSRLTTENGGSK